MIVKRQGTEQSQQDTVFLGLIDDSYRLVLEHFAIAGLIQLHNPPILFILVFHLNRAVARPPSSS
jgi:hypothetical protein